MNIADVCARLAELERDLTVEVDGSDYAIVHVYDGPVPNGETAEFPCFMHKWSPSGALSINGYPNGFVMDDWTIHVQSLIAEYPSDSEIWAQVASRFFIAWREMLVRNLKLGDGGVALQRIRMELEQPTVIGEEGSTRYIGFDCFLDLQITESLLVGVGA